MKFTSASSSIHQRLNVLIIFDCDGVLVDSESLAAEIFSNVLSKFDIDFSSAQCYQQFHGRTLAACYTWIEKNFNTKLDANFDAVLREETTQQFSKKLKPVPGIESVLKKLKEKNIPFCVASNGGHEKIANSLSVTKLNQFVVHRFSVEDVARGKPEPDLFLFAAEKMGFFPQECVVVEDSESGVAAALAAQMRVLKYLPAAEGSQLSGKEFARMDDLPKLLGLE